VSVSAEVLSPSEAAERLGVSAKALRLYEQRGLIKPIRTAAGWRAYGPKDMARLSDIVALRALGLSMAQMARVLDGDALALEPALAAHQATLEGKRRQITEAIDRVSAMRADLGRGEAPAPADISRLLRSAAGVSVAFALPWPWGGESFELRDIKPLTYIIGPLGSGKTRLAQRLAEMLPDAAFLGLDRLTENGDTLQSRLAADPGLKARIDRSLAWLVEDGATLSGALVALLAALESDNPAMLVIDMIEQGLDQATQEALIAHLRGRGANGRPLFLLTRSSAVLDLAAVGPDEAIILCPANHAPPSRVDPWPGAPGYEAVATCLASPQVRARTEGVIAWRPQVA
jgi:DNA-binding transcriptional MerR regulator